MRLEELTKGAVIEGGEPEGPVTVVAVEWAGDDAVELIYKDGSGGVRSTLPFRSNEPKIEGVDEGKSRDFSGDGRLFRLAAEAYRLKMAHLFDPLLAVRASLVEPLPHQISAVYERMLGRQPLRFLLADDPGAGKTIMAGLLMKELSIRGDLVRCLVCCPGSLVEQWQDELWQKFGLPFEIVAREQIEASRSGNPFAEQDLIIGRLDHLRREEVREKLEGTDWDLVIVDEAHKMSATFSGGEVSKTKRYLLGEVLSRISRYFLLMSATPHNGKEEDFQLFMRLLDPDRFEGRFRLGTHRTNAGDPMRRMVKEDLERFDGTPLFPDRYAYTVGYELSPEEEGLYEEVTAYVREEFDRAEATSGRVRTVSFALTILQRRLASSPEAISRSLTRRRERLEERLRDARKAGRVGVEAGLDTLANKLEDFDEVPGDELEEAEEQVVDLATAAGTVRELEREIETLKRLESKAKRVLAAGSDRKWEQLSRLLQDESLMFDEAGRPRKLIVFTEHRDTLGYLSQKLTELRGSSEAVVTISGGMRRGERQRAQERFLNNPEVTVLLATDAAGEGVNLQRANLMVNYDLPWNPNRLEQRFGRIHRIGQTETCHLWNLVADGTREGDVYRRLLEKLEEARKALGGKVFDVLGEMFRERPLRELLVEAIRHGREGGVSGRVAVAIEDVMERRRLEAMIRDQALTHEVMDPKVLGRIREDMERAEARRLQPHFVASFFLEVVRLFGGSPREREPGRYELKRVPRKIYEHARSMPGGHRISDAYERITFEKDRRNVPDAPPAKFLYPGHPLLDAAVEMILERCGGVLSRGTLLVDETDPGEELRTLVMLEHAVYNGRMTPSDQKRVASRRMQFVELKMDGEAREAGFAPYLDYRPPRKDELPLLDGVGSVADGIGERARRYAAAEIVPEHLEEIQARREAQVEKVRAAVQERLTREISFWDRRSVELRQRERMGGPADHLNAENAARRRDELIERRERRLEELERERHLMPAAPVVVGVALIVPAGLISLLKGLSEDAIPAPAGFARDPEAIQRVENLAMQAVIMAELALGNEPRDVSARKLGYDVESKDARSGRLRMIEVKGRIACAATVAVTRNEILTALNRPEDFILALVEVDDGGAREPRYVRCPFEQEPDFTATSVNYDLKKLLVKGASPG